MYYDRPRRKPRAPDARAQTAEDGYSDAPETGARKRRFWLPGAKRRERERLRQLEEERRRREAERRKPPLWWLFGSLKRDGAPPATAPASASEQAPKRKRHLLLKLAALILMACALCLVLLYALPVSWLGGHDKALYAATNSLPSGYTHVLLIGVDRDANGTSRSDTMLIASVGKGNVKLTTLLRDTGVVIPGRSGVHRLNSAYAYGGAELLLRTVNQNFGLNVTRYALADYESFPALIDALGGVDMEITAAEAEQINANTRETFYNMYASRARSYDDAYALWQKCLVPVKAQSLRLNGYQALGYARIRKLDSDYGRTSRQRKLLIGLLARLKACALRPVTMYNFINGAFSELETNMNALEIISLGEKALLAGGMQQARLPATGTYIDDGGMFASVDFAANHSAFITFIYDD